MCEKNIINEHKTKFQGRQSKKYHPKFYICKFSLKLKNRHQTIGIL